MPTRGALVQTTGLGVLNEQIQAVHDVMFNIQQLEGSNIVVLSSAVCVVPTLCR